MVKKAWKKYSSPELYVQLFTEYDVITASASDENIKGIPLDWLSGEQGGDF